MNPIKSLARYIYENQKRGFSDFEIIQLLEESGWSHEDIEVAMQKALTMHRTDRLLSIPVEALKNGARVLPSKIKGAVFLLLEIVAAPFKFIADYFRKKSEEKKRREKSIDELSKYIEKNLREGVLESDIFVELLRLKWSEGIINKSLNIANSKILKENIAVFVKKLVFSPVVLVKKAINSAADISKSIFIDYPVAIFIATKKMSLFLCGGARNFFVTAKSNLAVLPSKIISKTARPKISFRPPTPDRKKYKHRAPAFSFKPVLSDFADFWKKVFLGIILFPKRIYSRIAEVFLSVSIKKIPYLFSRFAHNLKYLINHFPSAAKRLHQRFTHFSIRFAKSGPKKLLALLFAVIDFSRYDLPSFLIKWFFKKPILATRNFYEYLTGIQWMDFLAKIIGYFTATIKFIFNLIGKILLLPVVSFLKIKKETFDIPFEITERLISKIYSSIKKIILLFIARLTMALRSAKFLIVPASAEKAVEILPQSLVEVPVGKVIDRMRASDILRISVRMFKTRRMRTLLTILGIGIGIGAVLFLVSLGFGLQKILLEEIATSDALLSLDISTRDEKLIPLNKEILDKFKAMPEVSYVSPLVSIPGQVSLENVTANTMINGVLPNYFKLSGISSNIGQLFKEGEDDGVVISLPIVKLLNLGQVDGEITEDTMKQMIGKMVSVVLLVPIETEVGEEVKTIEFETKFKITGVMEDVAESFMFFPLSRLENAGISNYQSAKIKVIESNMMEPVRAQAVAMGFVVAALSDTIEQANKVFQVLQVILALFGIVALVVSAIGMFNTMTIALLERTQEIGIMKSLGASNQNVWELFLAESVIMGFLGGVGGLLVGYSGSAALNLTVQILAGALGGKTVQLFERPWWFIVTILIFSTVVGLFTGLWPARRAASIKILAALRYK